MRMALQFVRHDDSLANEPPLPQVELACIPQYQCGLFARKEDKAKPA
jgi:hypothetical protein